MRKKSYILGVTTGICTYLAWVTGHEILQYVLAMASLILLAVANPGRAAKGNS